MAFSYTITGRYSTGNKKVVTGTWTATSATSGNILTGLTVIETCQVLDATAVRASMTTDYTTTAGTIAIGAVTSNDAGTFHAEGY